VTPSETTTLPTIGWIGLGQMGHRMARHVAEAGYPMIVADAAKTDLAPKGAKIAGSKKSWCCPFPMAQPASPSAVT